MGIACYVEKEKKKLKVIKNQNRPSNNEISYHKNEKKNIINKLYNENIEENNTNKLNNENIIENNTNKLKNENIVENNTNKLNNENIVENRGKYEVYKKKILRIHNLFRSATKSPNLNEDKNLEELAQKCADKCAELECLDHPPILYNDDNVGEILFSLDRIDVSNISNRISNILEKEKNNYKYNSYNSKTKNYTQVIWKSTKIVGFGISQSNRGIIYFVGLYFPPGNILNQFDKNILFDFNINYKFIYK